MLKSHNLSHIHRTIKVRCKIFLFVVVVMVVALGFGAVCVCTQVYASEHVCACVEAGVTGKYMATPSSGAKDLN